jgi:hypothetical protein
MSRSPLLKEECLQKITWSKTARTKCAGTMRAGTKTKNAMNGSGPNRKRRLTEPNILEGNMPKGHLFGVNRASKHAHREKTYRARIRKRLWSPGIDSKESVRQPI